MKLRYKGKETIIWEESPKALLIKAGHDFIINDKGELIVGDMGQEKTIYQLQIALKDTVSIDDVKRVVSNILKLME